MKILPALLLMLCLVPGGQALAQDMLILQEQHSLDPLKPQQEESITDIHAYAESYYQDCHQIKNKMFTQSSQNLFCACVAANIAEVMTPENVSDIRKNNQKGAMQRDMIRKFLYVPCTIQPVYELILNDCLDDKNLQGSLHDPRGSCQCMAAEMTSYWRDYGLKIASDPTEQKHSATEPLIRFLFSKAYDRKLEYVGWVCTAPKGMRFKNKGALDNPWAQR